jgi:hypothetical protein
VKRLAAAALALTVAATGGCGLGPGEEREGGATLRITRDFGQRLLRSARVERVREGQTVMRLLQSKARVDTRFGGGFVQSIDGLSGRGATGSRDWFYFVNGVEADRGAAERELSPGDVVQWDYRRWPAAMRVPAIVGAFPEPFVHGAEEKRLPTRVECEKPSGDACEDVKRRLDGQGVAASSAPLGSSASDEVLRVVVARWSVGRRLRALAALEREPAASGVFARFRNGGGRLDLLDERGGTAREAPAGSGLLAAMVRPGGGVTWVVTGLDDRGVERAAALLEPRVLRDAFAVAATPAGPVRLPVRGGS